MSLVNVKPSVILDIYDHNLTPSSIKTIALDSKTRFVAAVIRNSGEIYDIGQDAAVALTVLRPDKTRVQITGQTYSLTETTRDDETITYYGASAELTQLALAIKGNLRAQFKITSGEQELRTEIFTINNGEALDAGDDPWAGDLDGHNLDEMAQSIEDLSSDVSEIQGDVSELKSGFFNKLYNTAYVTDSASGGIAHFVDGADDVPLKSLKVAIEPVQSGSGDPSPDNVRPITGWDAVKVYHSGENTEEATEYNISLASAGTVYGGTLDAVSGELTVKQMSVTIDGTESIWGTTAKNTIYAVSYMDLSTAGIQNSRNVITNMGFVVCGYNYAAMDVEEYAICIRNEESDRWRIYLRTPNTTLNDLKTWLASHNLQVVYALATPITYNLTPTEVKSLLGINNIWADTGDTSVEYRADTRLYIEKLTQPEEDDMVADSAITEGQFFMVGNTLYRALTNIASGATITVGTNAQRVSLSDALNLVNA